MSRVIFICEGASEKNLVERVLSPYWRDKGVPILGDPMILGEGNPNCNGWGGDVSFARLKIDLLACLAGIGADSYVTTIFDFYELHGEWPGQASLDPAIPPREQVTRMESDTRAILAGQCPGLPVEERFIPYFMLHEYEGLLFTDPEAITEVTKARRSTEALVRIRSDFNNEPESINTVKAPSTRLAEARANYGKTIHAHRIMQRIGVDAVRRCCPHFDQWLTSLEALP